MSKNKYSRRKFLGAVPCMALGSTTLFSSLINLKAVNSIIGSTTLGEDYKALVCVLMNGGNDAFNMLVPTSNNEYSEYANVRANLALPKADLLPINPSNSDGRAFGLHPSLTGLQNIFEQGDLAFINNVGTLLEPVSKTAYLNNAASIPLGLLSHIDQVMHWQTAVPQDRISVGWGGRMGDILKSVNSTDQVSMNISLSGNNIFQRGNEIVEYAINNDGAVSVFGFNEPEPFLNLMTEDLTDMMNKTYQDIFKDSYKGILKRSVDSNQFFTAAVDSATTFEGQFTEDNPLSQDLRMIAQTIAAKEQLGAKRQIFFVELGGFDNHDELLNNHQQLMSSVDTALSEFYAAINSLNLSDCVTTYTISDFARTLTSNGNGTDHAWGGNAIVMGGAVKGKRFYGDYPTLSLDTNLEVGGGILIPTTAADLYFAEIALWFGISPNDLSQVLPNIGNFYSASSGTAPIGFLL